MTNTYIYSIEELCYYIYHNVTSLTSELREEELINWIEEELELKECAKKLRKLILAEGGYKDIVVCFLLSCDYYNEAQIKELLRTLDEFINLPPIEIGIKRANNCLKYRHYAKALLEFEDILEDTEFAALDEDKKAGIFHNMGIALLHSKGPLYALCKFKEAYDKNNNADSLRHYFFILIMTKQEDKARDELGNYGLGEDYLIELKKEYDKSLEHINDTAGLHTTRELKDAKESGKISKFYQDGYTLIEDIKKIYRSENL